MILFYLVIKCYPSMAASVNSQLPLVALSSVEYYKNIMTIHLLSTLASIANTIDMINPRLNLHHVRTAFIASHIARLVNFSPSQQRKTVLAALVHDIGGLNEQSRLEPLNYLDDEDNNHSLIGSELLSWIPLFRPLNRIVRFHHTHWRNGLGYYAEGEQVPEESHLLFFADRLDVLYCQYRTEHSTHSGEALLKILDAGVNDLYKEEYINAFRVLSLNEHFWSVMTSCNYQDYIKEINGINNDVISLHNLRDITLLLSFIIDQFSQQIPWHSIAVGRIAGYLAARIEMSTAQTLRVEIGGLLHNIYSLDHRVPQEYTSTANKIKKARYPIEGIDDIFEWLSAQNSTTHGNLSAKKHEPEAVLIAIARQVVDALDNSRAKEVSLDLLVKRNQRDEMHFFIMSLVAQYSSQIIQIYQTTAEEVTELVDRIEPLTHSG